MPFSQLSMSRRHLEPGSSTAAMCLQRRIRSSNRAHKYLIYDIKTFSLASCVCYSTHVQAVVSIKIFRRCNIFFARGITKFPAWPVVPPCPHGVANLCRRSVFDRNVRPRSWPGFSLQASTFASAGFVSCKSGHVVKCGDDAGFQT